MQQIEAYVYLFGDFSGLAHFSFRHIGAREGTRDATERKHSPPKCGNYVLIGVQN